MKNTVLDILYSIGLWGEVGDQNPFQNKFLEHFQRFLHRILIKLLSHINFQDHRAVQKVIGARNAPRKQY